MHRLMPIAGGLVALSLLAAGCQGASPTSAPAAPLPGPETSLEATALAALYHATGGPGWTNGTGWLSDAPAGQWHGVAVDERGSVIELDLAGNGLSGTIPPELAGLAELTYLRLAGNRLSGTIPPELGGLANLTHLLLARNRLSGTIPPELGGLANLTHLRLARNRLSGEIPAELGGLASLKSLSLSHNRLSGEIPPELGGLAGLTALSLDWNGLSGEIPAELGGLAGLTALSLDWNGLSGEIPAELGGLASLKSLSLSHNRLSGEIPPELGGLAGLTALSLNHNRLSGEIPAALVTLPVLADLRLEGNRLSGEIPPALQRPSPVRVAAEDGVSRATELLPELSLETVFGGRKFHRPTELGAYPVGPDGGAEPGLFVAEQDGRVLLLSAESDETAELLDIRGRVSRLGSEEGLLSVAVDPRFEETGHLWLYYVVAGTPRTSRLSRFAADLDDLRRVDPDSELVVLEIGQPGEFHFGGAIRFGPDGMLYLGLGDNSRAHEGQRLETLWGSVIRIDVSAASEASPYAVPIDNPFVGVPGARPEVWAYGFRNPWRMAFDPATGVLWAGDVGSEDIEEINRVAAGDNYGWPHFEGTLCARPSPSAGCDAYGLVAPVVTYNHNSAGCAVVGGVVYRGQAIPALDGLYLFADYCSGQLWVLPQDDGDAVPLAAIPQRISSFGTDADGEVYILTFGGAVLRIWLP